MDDSFKIDCKVLNNCLQPLQKDINRLIFAKKGEYPHILVILLIITSQLRSYIP